jgi:hypothetical protein
LFFFLFFLYSISYIVFFLSLYSWRWGLFTKTEWTDSGRREDNGDAFFLHVHKGGMEWDGMGC